MIKMITKLIRVDLLRAVVLRAYLICRASLRDLTVGTSVCVGDETGGAQVQSGLITAPCITYASTGARALWVVLALDTVANRRGQH